MNAVTWFFYLIWGIAFVWLIRSLRRRRAAKNIDDQAIAPTRLNRKVGRTGLLIGGIIAALFVMVSINQTSSSHSTSTDDMKGGALLHCQTAIRANSKNSARAVVPAVSTVFITDEQYAFEWKGGSGLQLQNSFGAMLDTYATCIVSRKDLDIDWLTIGNATLISRPKQ